MLLCGYKSEQNPYVLYVPMWLQIISDHLAEPLCALCSYVVTNQSRTPMCPMFLCGCKLEQNPCVLYATMWLQIRA